MTTKLSSLVRSERPAPARATDHGRSCSSDATVVLSGWREGARKVSAVRLLQAECGLSLTAAHRSVDRVLDGKQETVTPKGDRAAFVAELQKLGFVAHAP
jgi:hypothetical protein